MAILLLEQSKELMRQNCLWDKLMVQAPHYGTSSGNKQLMIEQDNVIIDSLSIHTFCLM